MDRGTYVAASSGIQQLAKIQVVTNNLANLDTVGYKRQGLVGETQTFEETLASKIAGNDPYARGDHERAPGVLNSHTVTDFSPGAIQHTGNPLNIALSSPNDFFVINTPAGAQYTRAGNFTLDSSGQVVTPDGFPVNGEGGPLIVSQGGTVSFKPDGSLSVDGNKLGRVQIVRFDDPSSLSREGMARFSLPPGAAAPATVSAGVIPASVESSNVSAISSMIDLISANRGFEQYTKAAQSIDSLNRTMVQQLGRE